MQQVKIKSEYITLGQFLKLTNCISSGGEVKFFLQEAAVLVNDQSEQRRGKKLYPNDIIKVEGHELFEVVQS